MSIALDYILYIIFSLYSLKYWLGLIRPNKAFGGFWPKDIQDGSWISFQIFVLLKWIFSTEWDKLVCGYQPKYILIINFYTSIVAPLDENNKQIHNEAAYTENHCKKKSGTHQFPVRNIF